MNPDGFTLRGLQMMAEGKLKTDWDRTAAGMALYLNAHLPRGKQVRPAELNPWREQPRPVKLSGAAALAALKMVAAAAGGSKTIA